MVPGSRDFKSKIGHTVLSGSKSLYMGVVREGDISLSSKGMPPFPLPVPEELLAHRAS